MQGQEAVFPWCVKRGAVCRGRFPVVSEERGSVQGQ